MSNEDRIKVLWVSRHAPSSRALQELQGLVGEYQLLWNRDPVQDIPSLFKGLRPQDQIVATLPLDMLEQLIYLAASQGMGPILRPVMRHRDSDGNVERWEFIGFEEVLEARVRSRRVGTWA